MTKRKSRFSRKEKAIMRVLYEARKPMSIREISEKADMSWVTVRKYLNTLERRGFKTVHVRTHRRKGKIVRAHRRKKPRKKRIFPYRRIFGR